MQLIIVTFLVALMYACTNETDGPGLGPKCLAGVEFEQTEDGLKSVPLPDGQFKTCEKETQTD